MLVQQVDLLLQPCTALIYLINETTGRKIMRMAIGPIGAIATGLILNILHLVGIVTLL